MGRYRDRPKKWRCFTREQQEAYERLSARQRKYVEYRGQGYPKTSAYKMAGFDGKVAGQAAYIMEKRNAVLPELISAILGQKKVRELTEEDSQINEQIDALATQEGAEKLLEIVEGGDGEMAKRIQFYRDVILGKIKTVRKTTKYNAEGAKVEVSVVELSDVETKIKARKELDRILGLNELPDLDKLQMGDITINIVDASKKDELADPRNQVFLDPSQVEVLDGEKVIVEEDKVEKEPPQPQQSSSSIKGEE